MSFSDVVQLPGFGQPTRTCQQLVPRGVCEAGHIQLATSSCELRRCPDHWREWATRGTEAAVARLAAYRQAQGHDWDRRMVHVVVSPETDVTPTERRLWRWRSEAQQIASDCGLRGGLMVTHPYRTTDELDRLYAQAVAGGLPGDHGKWRFARELAGGDWRELEQLVDASPHYHVVGPARDVDAEAVAGLDGWVVKMIRSLPRHHLRDPEPYEATAGLVWYLRSHAAHQQGRHSVSYFGAVHPATFDPAEALTASEWQQVQQMAGYAVDPPEAEEDPLCACDDCEAPVFEMYELPGRLAQLEWFAPLDDDIKKQLLGLKLWWVDGMAVPPPAASIDEQAMLAWLEKLSWQVGHGLGASASTAQQLSDF